MGNKNHVELDWAVDGITVGARHRKDLGDLDALVTSIREHGLLQPLTVTEEGVLVCGARRLAAIKQLGWRTVNVWVRVGLSQRLTAMMAEREDQTNLKPYTVTEMADLYEELKTEIAADAARRKQATQFGPGGVRPDRSGAAESAAPEDDPSSGPGESAGPLGDTRSQAAQILGGASYFTLDRIAAIRQAAADEARPDAIRQQAVDALKQIEDGAAVDPLFTALRSLIRIDDLEHVAADEAETGGVRDAARSGAILLRKLEDTGQMSPADLDKAARAALDRVKAARTPDKPIPVRAANKEKTPPMRTVKWFTWTWNEMKDWTTQVDPKLVAAGLTDAQWDQFSQTIDNSVTFRDTVADLRNPA
ncbi:MAG: ParB/RepB/Spo0J family partition protein [Propionibacteriaceae bacterium]|nr:ParB/RepB/Spo0J family partition protein [Propionibacteriaceae bacterium]